MKKDFINLLFESNEYMTFGDKFQTKVRMCSEFNNAEFFCINPLDKTKNHVDGKDPRFPSRADLNVVAFRNFMFEMDGLGLELQLDLLKSCGIPWTSIIYSGGKSYHAILSLQKPLSAPLHTREGAEYYKYVWRRLAAKLDCFISNKLGGGSDTKFIDHSCQNPSRLSRAPGFMRNGNSLQELILLNERMNSKNFLELFESCPEIPYSVGEYSISQVEVTDLKDFWQKAPTFLRNRLRYVDWAKPEGMYREIFKITVQAIDYTKVDKQVLLAAMEERLFPKLISIGYAAEKLHLGVDHGYNKKSREIKK